jgi:D-aminopeptidase
MRDTVGQAMDRSNPGGVLDIIFEPAHHNMRNIDPDNINE